MMQQRDQLTQLKQVKSQLRQERAAREQVESALLKSQSELKQYRNQIAKLSQENARLRHKESDRAVSSEFTEGFYQQIEATRQQLDNIRQYINHSSTLSKERLTEAIADFSFVLEELHVAAEELNAQNEELFVTRQAVEQERQHYQELFEFAPDGYLVTNAQGVIQKANHAAQNLLNLRRDFMIGKPLILFVAQADRLTFHQTFSSETLHSGRFKQWELTIQPREGEPFPAAIALSAIYNQQEQLELRWLIRNITKRQQAEAERHQQVERERIVAEIAQQIRQTLNLEEILHTTVSQVRQFSHTDRAIIYRFDPNWNGSGTVIAESVGQEWSSMLGQRIQDTGFAKESLVQEYAQGRLQITGDIEKADLVDCYLDFLRRFQIKANLVVPIMHGEKLWGLLGIQQCAQPRQWQPLETNLLQQLATQVAIAIHQSELYQQAQTELSERIQAEAELRASEERFRLIVEKVKDYAIFMLDPEGHVVSWNLGAERIKGYRRDEILGRHFSCFYPEENRQQGLPEQVLRIARTEGQFDTEGWRVRKDGSQFWANVVVTALWDAAGQLRGFSKVTRDISDRRRAEQVRLALEKEKELNQLQLHFFSMVSHEFRTPLSTILMSAQILEHSGEDWLNQKIFRNLHRIQASAKHTLRLLEDILTINRAKTGKIDFHPQPLDVHQFCRQVVEQFSPSNRQITIVTDRQRIVSLDEKLLHSVLSNLLSNAIKYSSGEISLTITCQPQTVTFAVQDRGIGIPSADLPKLFEPFHRGNNVGTIAGSGLGLTVLKQYIDLYGGKITVESQVDVGTTFTVTLPLKNHR